MQPGGTPICNPLARPAFTMDDLLAGMTWPTDQVIPGLIEMGFCF